MKIMKQFQEVLLLFTFPFFSAVKGLHVNFAPPANSGLLMVLSLLFGRRFPKLFGFTEHDVKRLFPCMEKLVVDAVKETGYMHIQSTKPDTAGERHIQSELNGYNVHL